VDKGQFGAQSPGRLIQILSPEPDWAFVPDPLPTSWKLPAELTPLLIEAREALARLDGAGRYLPGNTFLLRPLQKREALRSSALEGTFATAEELLAYGLEPKEPTSNADPANAWREVFNYDAALQQGLELLKRLPLSSRVIRELHATLLNGVRGTDRTPGVFRKRQVHIGSTRRFVPPPADLVEDLIAALERYINETDETDPLIRAFLAHYQFETIHPFLDGNGRVGRLLLSLTIFSRCNLQAPWLYLSPYFERYKDEYINCLFTVSTKGDWGGWISLCLRATISEAKNALVRVDNLLVIRRKYEERLTQIRKASGRLHKMLTSLMSSPLTTVPATAKEFGVSFPTAQADIRKLVAIGVLSASKRKSKPQYFVAAEYFEAAYAEETSS
jgi:Fic family protein